MNAVRLFLLVMVFFPSVTFGVIPAEIFPWATLYAFVATRYLDKTDAVLTAGMILILGLSVLWTQSMYPSSDALRSFLAYFNVIAVFVAVLNLPPAWIERTIRIARIILIFLVVLGLLQRFGLLGQFGALLSALVPRASGSSLVEMGNRGVTLLSSEPSRAGTELVLLYILYRLTRSPGMGFRPLDFALLAFLLLVVKAAQPLVFGVFAIGILVVQRPAHVVLLLVLFALVGISLPFISLDLGPSRALGQFEKVTAEDTLSAAVYLLANESGHRLLTVYAFFKFGLFHPFGAGVGAWQIASVQALNETGIDITQFRYFIIRGDGDVISVRGSGVLSNMMLDIGIFGVLAFLTWIFGLTRRLRIQGRTGNVLMVILLVKISFIGSVGEPLPWVVTALLFRHFAAQQAARRRPEHEPKPNATR